MSKYIVETFYTCSFKITHKLDELNEKKLLELENRSDGEVQIIDVKLNNRKTKTLDKNKNFSTLKNKQKTQSEKDLSSAVGDFPSDSPTPKKNIVTKIPTAITRDKIPRPLNMSLKYLRMTTSFHKNIWM